MLDIIPRIGFLAKGWRPIHGMATFCSSVESFVISPQVHHTLKDNDSVHEIRKALVVFPIWLTSEVTAYCTEHNNSFQPLSP